MTDKLTDKEIVKALECCCGIEHDCDKCPYEENDECGELNSILKDALDLINRQKEEIENLQQNLKEAHIDIKELRAEKEKLNQVNFDLCVAGGQLLSEVEKLKAEAYKEFAERLKEELHFTSYPLDMDFKTSEVNEFIDNLLKELEGGSNASQDK